MHARRAADKVKEVFRTYTTEEARANKVFAAPELLDANAFRMLLTQGGPTGRRRGSWRSSTRSTA